MIIFPNHSKYRPASRSRKRHKLRIPRYPILADPILFEPLLHVYSPGLVKIDPPNLHQTLDVALGLLVQSAPRIAFGDVAGQVEVRRRQARLDVAHKRGWDTGVREPGDRVLHAPRKIRHPPSAGEVEG